MSFVDPSFWRGKSVFLTGHTGFKGSWLSLWLQSMGAELHGYALNPPTDPSLFYEAKVGQGMSSVIGDIGNYSLLLQTLRESRAEIVIHMAAQSLVRLSYDKPIETYSTNVMGTVHLLEAVRRVQSVRAVVNVTTDKCYENREWIWGYREDEPMGGYDPYSNSKGCSELVTSAYRRSFFQKAGISLGSARAGNVIGGGDWAIDRLVPDILRAFEQKKPVVIRNPHAIRPWQHVLEPLSGYLILAQKLYENGCEYDEAWNFGPNADDARSVQWIVEALVNNWGDGASWQLDFAEHPHEANYLKLDISKAKSGLSWSPRWDLAKGLAEIISWHKAWLGAVNAQQLCLSQIDQFNQTGFSKQESKVFE